jgi:hypothetical protein
MPTLKRSRKPANLQLLGGTGYFGPSLWKQLSARQVLTLLPELSFVSVLNEVTQRLRPEKELSIDEFD